MKANIIIRQPVNLASREGLDLQKGDKIVCRRCGKGEIEVLINPVWGDPIAIDNFSFTHCEEVKPGTDGAAHCFCGGLMVHMEHLGRWHSEEGAKQRSVFRDIFGF